MGGLRRQGDAVRYCRNLTYAGYSDWRLPDIDTLKAQYSQRSLFSGVNWLYWSSTLYSYGGVAYRVDMSNGVVNSDNNFNDYWVWPCRSGQ